MNPVKLALLINDTWDAVESSKVGLIYLKDSKGEVIKNAEGSPYINAIAVQVFNQVLQARIIRGDIHES